MILFLLAIVVALVLIVAIYKDSDPRIDTIEIRPQLEPVEHDPSLGVDFTAGGQSKFAPKYKDPFVPYDPVNRKPVVMESHDEAKDATGVSSGFGHDDYKAPKE